MAVFRSPRFLAASLLLLAGILLLPSWAGAETSKELEQRLRKEEKRLDRVQDQITFHRKKVKEMAEREKGVIQEIESLAEQVTVTEQRMTVLELKRSKVQNRMGQLVREIRVTSGRIGEVKDLLKERMVAIYKYGGVAEFNLLLSAPGARDALATSYLLGKIADQDQRLIRELSDRKTRLDSAHQELREQKSLLENQNRQLAGQKQELQVATNRRNNLLDRVRKEKSLHEAELEEAQRVEREINSVVTRLMAEKRRRLAEARKKKEPGAGTEVVYYKGGRLHWPLRGQIRSPFGVRVHPVFRTRTMHTGLDIDGRHGDPIRAAENGEVLYAGWLRGYGQVVILDHGGNLTTVYAHMSRMETSEGDRVKVGEVIGRVGATGVATGSHLHFEVRVNGKATNPMKYLQ